MVGKVLFPRVITLCLYEEPQPQKREIAPHHRPQTPSFENPKPQKPNQKPQCQTTIKLGKLRKKKRKNLRTKYSLMVVIGLAGEPHYSSQNDWTQEDQL